FLPSSFAMYTTAAFHAVAIRSPGDLWKRNNCLLALESVASWVGHFSAAIGIPFVLEELLIPWSERALGKQNAYSVAFKLAPVYWWLGLFSLQPHKEERFLFVMYPLIAFNSAVALVCVGGDWYRFPSHYFLPGGTKLSFVKSGFDGLLPKPFPAGSWQESTSTTPDNTNNQNKEEMDRYVGLFDLAVLN
ncbi:mannosyltransferase, partial [Massospora cicadina]